jgi:hypothetical protein
MMENPDRADPSMPVQWVLLLIALLALSALMLLPPMSALRITSNAASPGCGNHKKSRIMAVLRCTPFSAVERRISNAMDTRTSQSRKKVIPAALLGMP